MKQIFLNLKRFDIPSNMGGVNRRPEQIDWGGEIIRSTQKQLSNYKKDEAMFTMFFPEAHIQSAVAARQKDSNISIGCQSVYKDDVSVGGNFGAFTSHRTASSMKAIGCNSTIIGHCEERRDKLELLSEAGASDTAAVDRILNKQALMAQKAGLHILYCIGETEEQQKNWQDTLKAQLEIGTKNLTKNNFTIAYEPVWAIGPGRTPPEKEYITKIAGFIKEVTNGAAVVYGGGLKKDNAGMLSQIKEIDGGLIALTRFSGEIGFYPEEYLEIIKAYMGDE